MSRDRLFHLIAASAWAGLPAAGHYRPPSLAAEGFVHLSYGRQVLDVANRLYRDVVDLVAVEFARSALSAPLIEEDSYGAGQEFPHLYGPLPVAAAVAVHPLQRVEPGDAVWAW